jgi:hypothetical protein
LAGVSVTSNQASQRWSHYRIFKSSTEMVCYAKRSLFFCGAAGSSLPLYGCHSNTAEKAKQINRDGEMALGKRTGRLGS